MAKKIDASKKIAGLLIPVFALRRAFDIGIGDTMSVIEAIDFLARHKLKVLQLLPINETGPDNSPYNAISSIALDPVYITVETKVVPCLTSAMIEAHAPAEMLQNLTEGPVQYATVKALKLKILADAFDIFKTKNSNESEDFAAFQAREKDWLDDYALFRALIDEEGGNVCWTYWRKEYQNPADARKALAVAADSDRLNDKILFYKFVQWIAFLQWGQVRNYADGKGVELMGDTPFGVSRYSADVWGKGHLFELKWSGGAPPER